MAAYTIPPLLNVIRREADLIAPNRSHASDGMKGDPAHAQRTSDHNPDPRGYVHAIDITHDPKRGFDARAEGEALRQRCASGAEQRVKYLVSYDDAKRYDVIASPVQAWVWRRKGGSAHASHLHISINSGPAVENSTAQMLRPQAAPVPAPAPAPASGPTSARIVAGAHAPEGYYQVSNTGAVYAWAVPYCGGWNGHDRNADFVGIAPCLLDGKTIGYWLAAADGGILTFGYAAFYGSLGGTPLNSPIVGIAATKSGGGYWLFGADGGVFAFGDAPFMGAATGAVV